jgi:crotonobetainyl-CoA:carnitine CoA-transferase CaiB-like acyl-CoA transferase
VSRGACDDLVVLELGAGSIAASLTGMLLADNGARVIKLEPPTGDRLRASMPSGSLVWNRGKESMIVDLRTSEGQDQARSLAQHADVLIEAFGTGVAAQWGIGYESIHDLNPGLVYCSIKGFGSEGAYAHIPAYEGLIQAKAGTYSMGMFGFRSGPIFSASPNANVGAGHFGFAGVMSALLVRQRTGRGQRVEASMFQGLNPYDYCSVMMRQYAVAQGIEAGPAAGFVGRVNLIMKTKDGQWVVVNFVQAHHAQAVSRALGRADTIDDPRYSTQPFFADAEAAQAWEDLLWDAFAEKTYAEWEPILLADNDLGFELLRTSEAGLDHAQVRHNGDAVVVEDPRLGAVTQVAPVAALAGTRITRSAPELGEHDGPLLARPVPTSSGPSPVHPLEGTTIVELGFLYAMPFGTTLAAAMGARVIKLEDRAGDPARRLGAEDVWAAKVMEGKESLSLDLRSPQGRRIAHELIATADVFVNGFRAGATDRLGLDRTTLTALNPQLVYVDAPGYGVSGPYGTRPMYAHTSAAIVGAYHRYANTWLDPELAAGMTTLEAQAVLAPRLRAPTDGDANPPLAVFSSILLGVYAQRVTGQGQYLFTDMIRANALALADDFCRYDGKPAVMITDPENYGLGALYRLYPAGQDSWVFLAAPRQKEWEALVLALERSDLLTDARFADAEGRQANDAELAGALGAIFATHTAGHWEEALLPKGIGCVEVFAGDRSEFVLADPVLRETGLVVETDHPKFGRIIRHGLPVAMSETPGRVAAGCLRGQHTEVVVAGLGYSNEQIAQLVADEVIFPADS